MHLAGNCSITSMKMGGDYGCMKGSVQYHAPAKRYYISWYPVKIWKNPITNDPFWHQKNAEKILDKMRCEEDAGIELEMVRDILGHTNSNMTRRYCHRSNAVMTKILEFRGKEQPMKEEGEG